ncbi:Cell division cycle-related protein res2/pct1 [Pichia kudriavzevii]|uniref:Transcription factor MBP1 n=1 Tax=Pichia kudriavzevii TaxID=4909 RepID=A0A1V2LP01_PICKU|nr:Cell division cycle-related protein res2/pct1 [Pichia kudriavzevii]
MHEKLYSATYSGVPVYEFIHPKSSVMRRKVDGWVNATHILKVANFPKAKRTRILEKDVQTGVHEKVQGGYGKYQGTWVPLERAMEIANQFEVLNELDPVFQYVSNGAETPPPAPKHHHATTINGTRKPRTTKAPKPPNFGTTLPTKGRRKRKDTVLDTDTNSVTKSRQKKRGKKADLSIHTPSNTFTDVNMVVTPTSTSREPSSSFYSQFHEPSTAEFMSEQDLDKALANSETYGNEVKSRFPLTMTPIQPSSQPFLAMLDRSYVKTLYKYFTELETNPNCEMPDFVTHDYDDFNIDQPIDNQGNNLLHWACSMGDVKMCEVLLKRNCNVHILNNRGEEPIIRSVMYANCYTRRTFSKLLDLLGDCLLDIDLNGRTILHHIAIATGDKNNLPSSRYYTEILLIKIAEIVKSNDLFREFIDKQDIDGNTALHIFSFNNASKCIKILLGYNARVDLRNRFNDQVGDYLTENFRNDTVEFHENGASLNQNYESFSLRPFKPSFNAPIDKSVSTNQRGTGDSYLEPFQSQYYHYHHTTPHYQQPSYTPTSLLNLKESTTLNTSHVSTTSMKMNQLNFEVFQKLNELSTSFDNEIIQKNDDLNELNSIVSQMDNDITNTSNEIKKLLSDVFGLEANENNDQSFQQVDEQLSTISSDYEAKCKLLKRLIDRSQAMKLARIVQEYENESLSQISQTSNSEGKRSSPPADLPDAVLRSLIDLARQQIIRKKSVKIFVNVQSKCDDELKMERLGNYRRLVSKLSNMPISEVDSSLNSIEECLIRDRDATS